MIMRYHWGLGIGHTYSHGVCLSHASTIQTPSPTHHDLESDEGRFECHNDSQANSNSGRAADDNADDPDLDLEDAELGTSAQDEDPCFDTDSESELGSEEWQDVPEENEEFLELYDTYHTDY
jgi:hypothetical protein